MKKIEFVPYQTITLMQSAGGSHIPDTWVPPRQESLDTQGYNFGTLQVQMQSLAPSGIGSLAWQFEVEHSEDNLNFQSLISSQVRSPNETASSGSVIVSVDETKNITEFGRYLRPKVTTTVANEQTFAVRVVLTLSQK